jgi:hypothetical protein
MVEEGQQQCTWSSAREGEGGDAAVNRSNDVEKFRELVHVFTPASCGEHVLGEMKYVVPHPVVGNMALRAFFGVCTSTSTLINS